eukprot:14549195-Alexandrium_andersonii.AAC.1
MDGCSKPSGHQASLCGPRLVGPPHGLAHREKEMDRPWPLVDDSPAGHGATVGHRTASTRLAIA